METYQIDPARESMQQLDDFPGVAVAVIEPTKDDILKRESALMSEIITSQQLHHLLDAHAPLGWHQTGALLGQRECRLMATWHSLSSRNLSSLPLMPTLLTVTRRGLHAQP